MAELNIEGSNNIKEPTFPYSDTDKERLALYNYYDKLFLGEHFTAFNQAVNDKDFNKAYAKIRYVKANYAGLISKVVADMLFSEPIKIKVEDKEQQKWLDEFVKVNRLDTVFYESALSNSYLGDALFKLRIGTRMAGDKNPSIILSNVPPSLYFPELEAGNIDQDPIRKELAWTFELFDKNVNKIKKYLRKEIHEPNKIINQLFLMEGDKIKGEIKFEDIGVTGVKPVEETRIDKQLLVHFPNWKTVTRYWGISDYNDLDSLFFALNNRISKIDNILDKHSDPLLLVPPGILDENGKVKKGNLGVVEIQSAEDGKPEYVVWDASLENAFKEIEKLVEFLLATSEVSPDVLGFGTGQSDSGRALKFKMLRTIAKTARKRLYYDNAIKEIIYRAMLLAKAWGNMKAGEVSFVGEPTYPEIIWADGIPADETELIENENKRINAGTESVVDAIVKLDQVDEETATKKAEVIKKEKEVKMEMSSFNPMLKQKTEKLKTEMGIPKKGEDKKETNKGVK